jgi:hypothetical protein
MSHRSRTEQWKERGARSLSGGGGISAPFVKWPKDGSYAWLEGRVVSVWDGKYGEVATVKLTAVSPNLGAVEGAGEERRRVQVGTGDTLHVGLNYSALEGIGPDQEGHLVHLAFTGWAESKGGDRYRAFEVLEAPEDEAATGDRRPEPVPRRPASPGLRPGPKPDGGDELLAGDDDLPF